MTPLLLVSLLIGLLLFSSLLPSSSSSSPSPSPSPSSDEIVASMEASELEALFSVIESFVEESDWRVKHPEPCTDDLLPGMLCEQAATGADNILHVTRLQFGGGGGSTGGGGISPSCRSNATFPGSALAKLPFLRILLVSECIFEPATVPPELALLGGSLRELSIINNPGLTGPIPASLANLNNLEVLTLSQNNLSGPIPQALGKLAKLQQLDLSYNALTEEIPSQLGDMLSLSILDLSNNQLSGEIPGSMGSLLHLQKLDLSGNLLTGMVPLELGTLSHLQFLALGGNGLVGPLPSTMASLTSLQYLALEGNPMRSDLPVFLFGKGCCPHLAVLDLANCQWQGIIPDGLGHLSNLSVLLLSDNKLEGAIPASLGGLKEISSLNLSSNHLHGQVPFDDFFLQRLGEKLDLRDNSGLCIDNTVHSNTVSLMNARLPSCNSSASYPTSSLESHVLSSLSSWLQHNVFLNVLALICFLVILF